MLETIYSASLAEILPSSIAGDEDLMAAARALDVELKKLSAELEVVLHLPRLEQLSGDILDHLAAQYHCDFYQTDFPDNVKRDQIHETIFWHRIKGTPGGVEKAISTFMVNAKVEENWEYDGEPYFFRIVTRGLKYLSDEEDYLQLVYSAKNARSWLDGIIFDLTQEVPQTYHVGHVELSSGEVTTYQDYIPTLPDNPLYHGVIVVDSGEIIEPYVLPNLDIDKSYSVGILELEAGEIISY